MNMVNFLDGLDGLAAGVAAIAGATFAVIALSLGKPDAAILSAIVFGACLGFLRHNFYPARIFMGDSGALLLGFVLAAVSVQGLLKTAATVALFFPLLVLAVPIVDTTFVVARRLKHGQKVFEGDQAHLHHRFLRRGFSQRRAAVTIWVWCLSLAAGALGTRFIPVRRHGVWHAWPTRRGRGDRPRRARRSRSTSSTCSRSSRSRTRTSGGGARTTHCGKPHKEAGTWYRHGSATASSRTAARNGASRDTHVCVPGTGRRREGRRDTATPARHSAPPR